MLPLVCTWLLIFGTFYNVQYIKSIRPTQDSVFVSIPVQFKRPCLPYIERDPCYINQEKRVLNRTDDIYIITVANTESGGDYKYVHDTKIKVNNHTQSDQYKIIMSYLETCVNR